MMGHCDCGSYAINPALHGREPGKNLNLCDVCYWREEVKHLTAELASETKWAHDYQREAEALRTQLALLGKPAPDVQTVTTTGGVVLPGPAPDFERFGREIARLFKNGLLSESTTATDGIFLSVAGGCGLIDLSQNDGEDYRWLDAEGPQ